MKRLNLKATLSLLFVISSLFTSTLQGIPSTCRSSKSMIFETEKIQSSTLAASSSLEYKGGPIISNIHVVDILWGPNVNTDVAHAITSFYQDLLNSVWIDGFSQYNTTGLQSQNTNQVIGRGTFDGQFQITPINSNLSLSELDIQEELTAQLDAGNLPLPKYDSQGYLESVYVIEFPPNIVITSDDGSVSCIVFCAFHGDMLYHGQPIMYSIQVDFSGSGCDVGCGSGSMLENQLSVHSHELAECITDPEVSTGTLAWLDSVNGEIGDICNGQQDTVILNGNSYTVQKVWSNTQNGCYPILEPVEPPNASFIQKVETLLEDIEAFFIDVF